MKQRARFVATGVLSVLLLAWLGFLIHSSPRFAGSAVGAVFGITGTVLMLISLAYPLVKRIPFITDRMTRYVSLQTLLIVHVYTGIFGPLLAIVHTGHKFNSWLGITLTGVMLLVVVSGFAVRYLLIYVRDEITDKLSLLQTARGDLDHAWGVHERSPPELRARPQMPYFVAGLASLGIDLSFSAPFGLVIRTADSVADLEYAVRTHEFFKRWFVRALRIHIVLSVIMFVLLGLHIWAGITLGLRWLS